jgi:hypothetical protein
MPRRLPSPKLILFRFRSLIKKRGDDHQKETILAHSKKTTKTTQKNNTPSTTFPLHDVIGLLCMH